MYGLVGLAFAFSAMNNLFMIAGALAYNYKYSYALLLSLGGVGLVAVAGLLTRFVVFLCYRLNGAIFARRTGMVFPFPLSHREFESTVLAFALPCFLISGIVMLPAFFLPTFYVVTSTLVPLIRYAFLAAAFSYMLKNFSHEYDKKVLAFSLSIVPLAIIAFTLVTALLGVIA